MSFNTIIFLLLSTPFSSIPFIFMNRKFSYPIYIAKNMTFILRLFGLEDDK